VWERSVRATHLFLDEQDIVELRPHVAEELESDRYAWWVLESADHAIVGFLAFARDVIEQQRARVLPATRLRRYGTIADGRSWPLLPDITPSA
jgi:hypothetical protein